MFSFRKFCAQCVCAVFLTLSIVCAMSFAAETLNELTPASQYLKKAMAGDAVAQNALGDCYSEGKWVPQSDEEAFKWYIKAAEQGLAEAQYNVALCYEHGAGVAKDYNKAHKWYTKSAEQGYPDAVKKLGPDALPAEKLPVIATF